VDEGWWGKGGNQIWRGVDVLVTAAESLSSEQQKRTIFSSYMDDNLGLCQSVGACAGVTSVFALMPLPTFCRRSLEASCDLSVACSRTISSHWTDCNDIWHLSIFWKSVEKIHVSLESDKNNGYFTRRPLHIFIVSLSVLRMRNVFRQKLYRKSKHTFYVR
jgi:hypothetical protein